MMNINGFYQALQNFTSSHKNLLVLSFPGTGGHRDGTGLSLLCVKVSLSNIQRKSEANLIKS